MKPIVYVLCGATATGKTDLSFRLSEVFPLGLINADASQVFRGMNVGTAKPTKAEHEKYAIELIDILNPDEEFTASDFASAAAKSVERIAHAKKIPLLVGGAGFYLRAFEKPPLAPSTPQTTLAQPGDYDRLKALAPEVALRLHPNDRYRIARALSLVNAGIEPHKAFLDSQTQPPLFELRWIGLKTDRKELHQKINIRVERMFQNGLIDETKKLLHDFPNSHARLERTIGYREALSVLNGTCKEAQALTLVQAATRQYAKRQETWFRKEPRIEWIETSDAFDKATAILEKGLYK